MTTLGVDQKQVIQMHLDPFIRREPKGFLQERYTPLHQSPALRDANWQEVHKFYVMYAIEQMNQKHAFMNLGTEYCQMIAPEELDAHCKKLSSAVTDAVARDFVGCNLPGSEDYRPLIKGDIEELYLHQARMLISQRAHAYVLQDVFSPAGLGDDLKNSLKQRRFELTPSLEEHIAEVVASYKSRSYAVSDLEQFVKSQVLGRILPLTKGKDKNFKEPFFSSLKKNCQQRFPEHALSAQQVCDQYCNEFIPLLLPKEAVLRFPCEEPSVLVGRASELKEVIQRIAAQVRLRCVRDFLGEQVVIEDLEERIEKSCLEFYNDMLRDRVSHVIKNKGALKVADTIAELIDLNLLTRGEDNALSLEGVVQLCSLLIGEFYENKKGTQVTKERLDQIGYQYVGECLTALLKPNISQKDFLARRLNALAEDQKRRILSSCRINLRKGTSTR